MENNNIMDPNFVPDEYKVPYDLIELPSQGIFYPNKKSSVKVEYLTALDENILSSPNIVNNGKLLDILIERKVKELGFDPLDLLEGDRTAIILFLRVTGFGAEYHQLVRDPKTGNIVEGVIDLGNLKNKPLSVKPDNQGEFDFILPNSGKTIKFKFLTGRDESEIENLNTSMKERYNSEEDYTPILKLERTITEIDGIRDKVKISNIVRSFNLSDTRKLNKYIKDLEPGVDLRTTATIPGGGSVDTFLRFGSNFFWPEL